MSKKDRQYPLHFGEKHFHWILPESEKHTLPGDDVELHEDPVRRKGRNIDNRWYGLQIALTVLTVILDLKTRVMS